MSPAHSGFMGLGKLVSLLLVLALAGSAAPTDSSIPSEGDVRAACELDPDRTINLTEWNPSPRPYINATLDGERTDTVDCSRIESYEIDSRAVDKDLSHQDGVRISWLLVPAVIIVLAGSYYLYSRG